MRNFDIARAADGLRPSLRTGKRRLGRMGLFNYSSETGVRINDLSGKLSASTALACPPATSPKGSGGMR